MTGNDEPATLYKNEEEMSDDVFSDYFSKQGHWSTCKYKVQVAPTSS